MKTVLIAMSIVSLLVCGCDNNKEATTEEPAAMKKTEPASGQPERAQTNPIQVVRDGMAAYSSPDWEKSLDYFADDVVFTNVGATLPPAKGKAVLRKRFERFKTAFPDSRLVPSRVFGGDDFAVVEVVNTGTQTGPLSMGERTVEPSQKKFGIAGLHIAWFGDDGKIVRYDVYANEWAMMAQIGAVPLPEGQRPPALAKAPTGDPAIIEGEPNAANVDTYTVMMNAWLQREPLDPFVTTDVVAINHGSGWKVDGAEAYSKTAKQMMKPWSDSTWKAEQTWSIGDWVIATASGTAKHTGDVMGMKPTGKMVTGHVADVVKFSDGKVAWIATYSNPMEAMMQLKPPSMKKDEEPREKGG